MDKLGIEEYCKETLKTKEKDRQNATNVETDKIDEFNSFDVVSYNDSTNHMFSFTRCEFDKLLKDEKNFYTGEPLPWFVIEKIRCRINISKKYNLPKSKTLKELLQDCNFEKNESTEKISDEEEESDLEEFSDEEYDEEDINEISRYIVGRARDRDTGEENFIRFPVPVEIEESDVDDFVEQILDSRNIDYLGRVECTCPACVDISDVD